MDGIKVTQVPATLVRLGQQLEGTVHLTQHHMIFRTDQREIWISYPVVSEVVRRAATSSGSSALLRMVGKDFMFLSFQFASDDDAINVYDSLVSLCHPEDTSDLYAFVYRPAPPESNFNCWDLYDPVKEYRRMGIVPEDTSWRITNANNSFTLCPTYPPLLVVPGSISDTVLSYAAKFRSKGRLPVLSYYHQFNRCTISRCSQPLVGLKQHRSPQDEGLLRAIYATTETPRGYHGATVENLIVDLRPAGNAYAQTALGGGTENMDRYRPARKAYYGIDNLHVMRDSYNRVVEALRHGDVSDSTPSAVSLEKSQWLRHIEIILEGVAQVVQQVHFKCSHVVVHCSDGWDRTPQLTSLAMLLLDPYFRTLEGFAVLVEKEWVSFGHQFQIRNNDLGRKNFSTVEEDPSVFSNVTSFISETTRGRQSGPIFRQFLDCVYQLVYEHPNDFEFNERFLRRLLYHSYACQYGTFLLNNEREREEYRVREKTRSVWDYFMARKQQFLNLSYAATEEVKLPPAKSRWWAAAFGRSDADMNDPEAWRKDASPKRQSPSLTPNSANGSKPEDKSHTLAASLNQVTLDDTKRETTIQAEEVVT
ncbi:Phosphoinositide 3-phosphatase [Wickerhamiella sorbophila]|uniref:Phosphoinositide 3-phosphatase n=1 Tax=Wickerhamiella sorbophila TaxID=45607 RepID=A0A2T0FJA4_9ASCO|nr:Phosphoinositide 3-phosphatase [Wickerhamiella sorbophila]PRT55019.1 Phosphoinositide 3-phosphatase [Wickerhamiella sorbophila]